MMSSEGESEAHLSEELGPLSRRLDCRHDG